MASSRVLIDSERSPLLARRNASKRNAEACLVATANALKAHQSTRLAMPVEQQHVSGCTKSEAFPTSRALGAIAPPIDTGQTSMFTTHFLLEASSSCLKRDYKDFDFVMRPMSYLSQTRVGFSQRHSMSRNVRSPVSSPAFNISLLSLGCVEAVLLVMSKKCLLAR